MVLDRVRVVSEVQELDQEVLRLEDVPVLPRLPMDLLLVDSVVERHLHSAVVVVEVLEPHRPLEEVLVPRREVSHPAPVDSVVVPLLQRQPRPALANPQLRSSLMRT